MEPTHPGWVSCCHAGRPICQPWCGTSLWRDQPLGNRLTTLDHFPLERQKFILPGIPRMDVPPQHPQCLRVALLFKDLEGLILWNKISPNRIESRDLLDSKGNANDHENQWDSPTTKKPLAWHFPGGTMAKILCSQCRKPRFDPWFWN